MFWLESAASSPRELVNNSRVVFDPASGARLACVAAARLLPLVELVPEYSLEVGGLSPLNESNGALVRWYHQEAPLFAGAATNISLLSGGGAGLPDCLNKPCSLRCNASIGNFSRSTDELNIWTEGAQNLIIFVLLLLIKILNMF